MRKGAKSGVLAVFLKDKRTHAGFTQNQVAKKLGYSSPQFISNWERGLSNPPIATLKVLAELYQASSDEMFNAILKTAIQNVTFELREEFFKASRSKRA